MFVMKWTAIVDADITYVMFFIYVHHILCSLGYNIPIHMCKHTLRYINLFKINIKVESTKGYAKYLHVEGIVLFESCWAWCYVWNEKFNLFGVVVVIVVVVVDSFIVLKDFLTLYSSVWRKAYVGLFGTGRILPLPMLSPFTPFEMENQYIMESKRFYIFLASFFIRKIISCFFMVRFVYVQPALSKRLTISHHHSNWDVVQFLLVFFAIHPL